MYRFSLEPALPLNNPTRPELFTEFPSNPKAAQEYIKHKKTWVQTRNYLTTRVRTSFIQAGCGLFTTLPHRVVARDWFARTCIASNERVFPPLGTRYLARGALVHRATTLWQDRESWLARCRSPRRESCGRGPSLSQRANSSAFCRIDSRITGTYCISRRRVCNCVPAIRRFAPVATAIHCYMSTTKNRRSVFNMRVSQLSWILKSG